MYYGRGPSKDREQENLDLERQARQVGTGTDLREEVVESPQEGRREAARPISGKNVSRDQESRNAEFAAWHVLAGNRCSEGPTLEGT